MIISLSYMVLTDALHALKAGNIRYCEALGFTYDEMNTLNQLSLDELFIISRASSRFMNVTIHHEALRLLLNQSRQELEYQQQINRAIALGGSIELINRFFGLSCHEICARRRLLGICVAQGRTPHPPERIDAEIWLRWQKRRPENLASLNALNTMMHIAEELSFLEDAPTLTAVWNRISLCEKEQSCRRQSHAR